MISIPYNLPITSVSNYFDDPLSVRMKMFQWAEKYLAVWKKTEAEIFSRNSYREYEVQIIDKKPSPLITTLQVSSFVLCPFLPITALAIKTFYRWKYSYCISEDASDPRCRIFAPLETQQIRSCPAFLSPNQQARLNVIERAPNSLEISFKTACLVEPIVTKAHSLFVRHQDYQEHVVSARVVVSFETSLNRSKGIYGTQGAISEDAHRLLRVYQKIVRTSFKHNTAAMIDSGEVLKAIGCYKVVIIKDEVRSSRDGGFNKDTLYGGFYNALHLIHQYNEKVKSSPILEVDFPTIGSDLDDIAHKNTMPVLIESFYDFFVAYPLSAIQSVTLYYLPLTSVNPIYACQQSLRNNLLANSCFLPCKEDDKDIETKPLKEKKSPLVNSEDL